MYKLLALDMDGTLLNNKKEITDKVRNEIKNLQSKNIDVTIATGRFPASVWLHAKELNLKTSLVALNGAVILDPINGEPVETMPILENTAKKIVAFSKKYNVYVHFYGYNTLFVEKKIPLNEKWFIANVVMDKTKKLHEQNYGEQLSHFKLKETGVFINFFNESEMPPLYKATIIDDDSEKIEDLYQEISKWPELSVTRTGKRRFDINAGGVSKKIALQHICGSLNIKDEEVVVAGDYDNDAEMIKWAGLGVAMGNSNDYIKSIADDITLSNEEDGVAAIIQKHF